MLAGKKSRNALITFMGVPCTLHVGVSCAPQPLPIGQLSAKTVLGLFP